MTKDNNPRNRRTMWGPDHLDVLSRRNQATRDALNRKKKQKQSQTVKRHVLYKQKKHLLNQIVQTDDSTPIIASELGRPGEHNEQEDNDDNSNIKARTQKAHSKETKPAPGPEDTDPDGKSNDQPVSRTNDAKTKIDSANDETETNDTTKADNPMTSSENRSDRRDDADIHSSAVNTGQGLRSDNYSYHNNDNQNKPFKYTPFAKQRREYEELRRQREEERRQKELAIEKREEMLKQSKKRRNNISKQYRKKNQRGQPKLKYRMQSMLNRIEKQFSHDKEEQENNQHASPESQKQDE